MRISYMLLTTAMAFFVGMATLQAADKPDVPQGPLEIKGSRKTVTFSHQQGHADIECVKCHHPVDDKPTWQKCSTSGCHDNLTEKKGEQSLYFVMHSKKEDLKYQTCMSCHAKIVSEKPDLKKKLTGCTASACHPAAKKDGKAEDSEDSKKS